MTVPINITDYPRDCNSSITPFMYFKALLHGIISLSCHVLSNDSFVAYVDFFHNNEGGKKIFKGKCNYKNVVLKNNYTNIARGMWDGAVLLSSF